MKNAKWMYSFNPDFSPSAKLEKIARSILIDRLLCLCRIFPNVDDSDLAELGADSVRELVDKSAHALVSDCHGQSTATKIYVSVHIYSWHSYP